MKLKKKFFITLLGTWIPVLACFWAWAWQTNINGSSTDPSADDDAFAVAVDAAGNVVAAGYSQNSGTSGDFTVVKLDVATGVELWRHAVNGTANSSDAARAVTVDGAGNVVAAGFIQNTGTFRDFIVIKFDGASGTELWRYVINGSANAEDEALAITVDVAGNVIAGGFTRNIGTGTDFTVLKLNGSSGEELWRRMINGTAANSPDEVRAVTVDSAGNVVAAGFTANAGVFDDFTVVKLNGNSGEELWRRVINGTASLLDRAHAVAIDAAGNVVAAGFTRNAGTFDDFTVIKFNGSSGAELWRRVINGTANSADEAHAIAVDSTGNVVAAGTSRNTGSGADFTVIKLDGINGAELWRRTINGTANFIDEARAVTVDADGNVVAAGRTDNTGSFSDFTVVKLDAGGVELWRRVINGTNNSGDEARVVAMAPTGDVVAAGFSTNTSTIRDFTVIHFAGTSGAELWSQRINGIIVNANDWASRVTVDASGDVVAAGLTDNSATSGELGDFTVVKIEGTTGTELWRWVMAGTANGFDQALAVTVDAGGNVVAAGYTWNVATSEDFAVVKLDGANGTELWRQLINGGANSFDRAHAVTVDNVGDVVAAGFTRNGSPNDFGDFSVIKFDGATGTELWRQIINGAASFSDSAAAVAVDAAGDVLAAGRTDNSGSFSDFTVIKLDGASGAELWRQVISRGSASAIAVDAAGDVVAAGNILGDFTVVKFERLSGAEIWRQMINGTGNDFDGAAAVTLDPGGNAVAVGLIRNLGTFADFTVVKFDGASGAELWRQEINGTVSVNDQAFGVTVDSMGDVVAAGVTRNTGSSDDFTVIKFDGASGAELWRRQINGTLNANESALSVAVDTNGDVLAAGDTRNTITLEDFTVVKLRGTDGSDF